jgi:hemolysin III
MAIRKNEIFNSISHLAGAIASAGMTALFVLMAVVFDPGLAGAVALTGISYIFLFASSFMHHATKEGEDGKGVWLALDHCAIFVMMAGSYIGPLYIFAPEGLRRVLLGGVALCAVAGLVLKIRFIDSPNWVSVAIYAPLGLISLVPMTILWHVADGAPAHLVPLSFMKALLVIGLVMYGLGGIVYALRRPDPGPGLFGFHGVFHVCVLAGAGLHGTALYYSIKAYPLIRECVTGMSG